MISVANTNLFLLRNLDSLSSLALRHYIRNDKHIWISQARYCAQATRALPSDQHEHKQNRQLTKEQTEFSQQRLRQEKRQVKPIPLPQPTSTSSSQSTENIVTSYDIDWIFPRLKYPSRFWYIASQLAITAVGFISKFVLNIMSRTQVYNEKRLIAAVAHRPPGLPLVTVSNHHSCFDDPAIWAILPLRYLCNSYRVRWSMAAHDICFTNKWHSKFFMYGKCIPVVRGIGVYQNAIDLCIQKCAHGDWVHVFPEGKVNMTKEEMRLKWGVGRIIYESPRIPIILPLWHEGMDEVLPNVEPYIFRWGKKVTINIGEPIDLNDFIQNLKDNKVPEPEARKLITDKIEAVFRELRLETEELHKARQS